MALPAVTVIVPTWNEVDSIDACLESLAAQDYEGTLSVVVADGGSTDGTLARLEEWRAHLPGLEVIANRDRVQSTGLNLAARTAPGDLLVRADAHTTYEPDYVRRSVDAHLETGSAVGGVMAPEGTTPFGRAVAFAMTTPLTIGTGKFHYATERAEVDTVYLGAFPKSDFLAVGGLRTFPSGVAEDADFYYRWRRSGRTVVVDPSIRSTYRPRQSPGRLFSQYFRYGEGKAEMLFVNRRLPSWRPLAPLALVSALVVGSGLGVALGLWWPLAVLVGAWLALLALSSLRAGRLAPLVVVAAAIMHVAYGLGMVLGLLRGRRARRTVPASGRAVWGVIPAPPDDPAQQPDG